MLLTKLYKGASEIYKIYKGADLLYDFTPIALTPIMTRFRVEGSNLYRVYFDTPLGSADGVDPSHFTINGKNITSVNTTLNYFTVNEPFSYWQKGYTIKKTTDDTVYGFTMEHIDNQIAEPTATGVSYYVRISGSDSNDGLSLDSAWLTLTHADDSTSAGDTIYVKEGVYNENPSAFSSSGTISNPKKWIGFISDPTANGGQGDITSMYYNDYDTDTILTSEMPTITGSGQTDINHGFDITGQYHIFKNFQATGFDQHFRANSGNVVFERCLAYDSVNETFHSKVRGFNTGGSNTSVIDCRVRNMARSAFYHGGSYNLIKDCKAWCDNTVSVNQSMDYYFGIYNASNNVIKDCYGRRTNNSVPHGGHSCSIESDAGWGVTTDNLIDGLESVNVRSIEWRAWSEDNVAKNVNHYPLSGDTGSRGVYDRDGNRNNILENSKIEVSGGQEGIFYWNTSEGWNGLAENNIYRNNIFIGNGAVFLEINDANGGSPALTNNKYYNNTIDGFGTLVTVAGSPSISGNEFKGNLIDATSLGSGSGFSFDYNNFTGGIGEQGTNSSAVDPNFVDTANFEPQTDSLIRLPKITDINYDRLGNERNSNLTTVGAVLHADESTVSLPNILVALDGSGDFTTVQAAVNSAVAGDIIGLKGGDEFQESVTISSKDNITLTSYGTGQAVIKGSEEVIGWTDEGGGVWSKTMSESFQVFKDGEVVTNGRLPLIAGIYENFNNYYTVTSGTGTKNSFQSNDLIGVGSLVGAMVHIQSAPWVLDACEIATHNDTTGDITLSTDTGYNINGGESFFVNNHTNLLTVDAQWCYQSGKLYYKSVSEPTGISATTSEDSGVSLVGSSNMNFENIKICDFGVSGISNNTSTNIVVDNCELLNNYENAYLGVNSFNGNNCIIKNSVLKGSNKPAISTNENDLSVLDNTIEEIGLLGTISQKGGGFSAAISPRGDRSIVLRNRMGKLGYNGISFDGTDNDIRYNYIYDYCLTLHDGGGIYSFVNTTGVVDYPNDLPAGVENSVINYNTIHAYDFNVIGWYANGIYFDNATHDVQCHNNTVINSLNSAVMNTGIRNSIRFNKLYNPIEWGFIQNELAGNVPTPDWSEGNVFSDNEIFSKSVIDDISISASYPNNTVNQPTLIKKAVQGGVRPWTDMFTEMDRNIYYNPYKLTSHALEGEAVPPSNRSSFDLGDFSTDYTPFETNSTQDNLLWLDYELDQTIGSNIIESDFESGTDGWSMQDGTLSLQTDDTQYVRGSATSFGRLKSKKWTQVNGTKYRIQFDAWCDEANTYQMTVEQSASPWATFYSRRFDVDSTKRTMSFIYDCIEDSTLMEVRFNFANSNADLNIDNFSIIEVSTTTLPQRDTCIYNETNQTKSVPLPSGTWNNLDGTITNATGSIVLQPYTSEILIKQ